METFNSYKPLTIFPKSTILDVALGSGNACAAVKRFITNLTVNLKFNANFFHDALCYLNRLLENVRGVNSIETIFRLK